MRLTLLQAALCVLSYMYPGAQEPAPREIRLGAADRVLSEELSRISGVFELPDGRVLLSDRIEERVLVIDFATGRIEQIGRSGAGPAEYHLPGRFVAWRGDSVLMVDEGNGRLAIIGPDLRIHRSFVLRVPGVPSSLGPRAVDGQGRIYAQIPRWAAAAFGSHGDSVPIVRLSGADPRAEVIAWVLVLADPPGKIRYGLPFVPFSPQDVWTGNSSGRIVVARSGDYHVEFLSDGKWSRGRPVPFTALPVTQADRLAYARRFLENSGLGGRGGANGNPSGMVPLPADMLTPEAVAELVTRNGFAERKPAFSDELPLLSPSGLFWVQRSLPNGAAPEWDVFDGSARLAYRVKVPAGRRLAAVGKGSVYAVVVDDNGVERLERYRVTFP